MSQIPAACLGHAAGLSVTRQHSVSFSQGRVMEIHLSFLFALCPYRPVESMLFPKDKKKILDYHCRAWQPKTSHPWSPKPQYELGFLPSANVDSPKIKKNVFLSLCHCSCASLKASIPSFIYCVWLSTPTGGLTKFWLQKLIPTAQCHHVLC